MSATETRLADNPSFLSLRGALSLSLIALGTITLLWVGQLIWKDITYWNKDLTLTFFGPRTGENISLGIGMKVVHYFFIGLVLLLPGLATFHTRPKRNKCPHYFGYLANLPRGAPIPQECLLCEHADCIEGAHQQ